MMVVALTLWKERTGSQAALRCGTGRHCRRGFLNGSKRLQVAGGFACCGLNTDALMSQTIVTKKKVAN